MINKELKYRKARKIFMNKKQYRYNYGNRAVSIGPDTKKRLQKIRYAKAGESGEFWSLTRTIDFLMDEYEKHNNKQ